MPSKPGNTPVSCDFAEKGDGSKIRLVDLWVPGYMAWGVDMV